MKIVNRKEFLRLPPETVYQKYTPCIIESHLSIKVKNCGDNDWWYQPLNAVDAKINSSMIDPSGINLESEMRDGVFDENETYLIWENNEVIMLINRLTKCLKDNKNE